MDRKEILALLLVILSACSNSRANLSDEHSSVAAPVGVVSPDTSADSDWEEPAVPTLASVVAPGMFRGNGCFNLSDISMATDYEITPDGRLLVYYFTYHGDGCRPEMVYRMSKAHYTTVVDAEVLAGYTTIRATLACVQYNSSDCTETPQGPWYFLTKADKTNLMFQGFVSAVDQLTIPLEVYWPRTTQLITPFPY